MPSQPDPLRRYAVHFTRSRNGATAARKALARPQPTPLTHIELVQWLDDIDDTGYHTSLSILWEGFVRPTDLPLCVGKGIAGLKDAHRSACFSESPLDELSRLIETRSLYGIGFTQDFLRLNGGQPVIYLSHGGAEAQRWAQKVRSRCIPSVDANDPLWQETPFIDELGPDPANDTSWENEWRVPGGLKFDPCDVAFLFLPEHLHNNARAFFAEHRVNNSGPAYLGRYLDPRWDRERIEAALTEPLGAWDTSELALPR